VAWSKLIGFTEHPNLATCDIDTFRYRVLPVAARITRGGRQTRLRIDGTWRWAIPTCKNQASQPASTGNISTGQAARKIEARAPAPSRTSESTQAFLTGSADVILSAARLRSISSSPTPTGRSTMSSRNVQRDYLANGASLCQGRL
jgi:hypothetical protein